MVRVSELRVGDYIRASWLGSGWHKVLEVGTSYSDSSKVPTKRWKGSRHIPAGDGLNRRESGFSGLFCAGAESSAPR